MRLKKVTMQAFGPFKDKVVVDFESNNINHGLLLITGDTGAGKTTIFDAVCYALYGKASGNDRDESNLRSDLADEDTLTYVELDFEYDNKDYNIKRGPSYLGKSKRGDGFVKRDGFVEFELNGIKLTKNAEVKDAIINLIGLDDKQFKQVAMLSQGEFTKFLLADTKEKTDIFQKIFNTKIFETISYKLKDLERSKSGEALNLKSLIASEKNKIEDIENLDSLNDQEVLNALQELIEKESKELNEIKTKRDSLEKDYYTKENNLKVLNETNNKIDELNSNKKEFNTLLENNKDIDSLRPIYEYNISAVPAIKNNLDSIERIKIDIKKYNELLNNAKAELVEANKIYESNKDKYESLNNYSDNVSKLNQDKTTIEENIKNLNNYLKIKDNLTKKQTEYLKSCEKYTSELNNLDEMKKSYYLDQAYVLANTLEDNKPCPVCGSINHPTPAVHVDSNVTKDLIDEKEKDVKTLLDDKTTIEALIENFKESIKELNIDEKLDINAEINKYKEDLEKMVNKLSEISNEYKIITKEKEDLTTKITKLNTNINSYNDNLTEVEFNLKEFTEGLEGLYKEFNTSLEEYNSKKLDDSNIKTLGNRIKEYDKKYASLKAVIETLTKTVGDKEKVNVEEFTKEVEDLKVKYDLIKEEYDEINKKVSKIKDINTSITKYINDYNLIKVEYETIKNLSDTANGSLNGRQKITFENFVQAQFLTTILVEANKRLTKMSEGRYELRRKETASNNSSKSGLDFSVYDANSGKERDVASLSGGEKFKASLALALGLSDVISMNAGGIKIDALFVDEGFGSLDQESLNQALNVLTDLVDNDKLVGIISHVQELISRIDNKIIVKKGVNGSTLSIEAN